MGLLTLSDAVRVLLVNDPRSIPRGTYYQRRWPGPAGAARLNASGPRVVLSEQAHLPPSAVSDRSNWGWTQRDYNRLAANPFIAFNDSANPRLTSG